MNIHLRPADQIIALMGDGRERTVTDMALRVGLQPKQVGIVVGRLRKAGKLIGEETPSGYPRIYRIAP